MMDYIKLLLISVIVASCSGRQQLSELNELEKFSNNFRPETISTDSVICSTDGVSKSFIIRLRHERASDLKNYWTIILLNHTPIYHSPYEEQVLINAFLCEDQFVSIAVVLYEPDTDGYYAWHRKDVYELDQNSIVDIKLLPESKYDHSDGVGYKINIK